MGNETTNILQSILSKLKDPNTGTEALIEVLTVIAKFMVQALLGFALIYFILTAIQLLSAGANQAQATNARKSILFIVIGIAIGVGALAGLNLIQDVFVKK